MKTTRRGLFGLFAAAVAAPASIGLARSVSVPPDAVIKASPLSDYAKSEASKLAQAEIDRRRARGIQLLNRQRFGRVEFWDGVMTNPVHIPRSDGLV